MWLRWLCLMWNVCRWLNLMILFVFVKLKCFIIDCKVIYIKKNVVFVVIIFIVVFEWYDLIWWVYLVIV